MFIIGTIAAFVGLLLVLQVGPMAWRLLQVRALQKRCQARGAVVLTFDDGPSPVLTAQLIKLLDSAGAKATFFVLGEKLSSQEAKIEELVAAGHEIGSHSHRHCNAWKCFPHTSYRDLAKGILDTEKWCGRGGWVRPPYGKLSFYNWLAVLRHGARLAWWTHDSGDTKTPIPDPKVQVDRLVRDGGGVLLLHDIERCSQRDAFVLAATQYCIEEVSKSKLQLMSFSEVMD